VASPDESLADFTAKLDALAARTAALEHDPDAPSVTESDGEVGVSVAPNGVLTGLRIEDAAWEGSGAALAARILDLTRAARRTAAAELVRTLGVDAAAAEVITGPEPARPAETDDDDFADERIFGGEQSR